jgi:hypothetical protein
MGVEISHCVVLTAGLILACTRQIPSVSRPNKTTVPPIFVHKKRRTHSLCHFLNFPIRISCVRNNLIFATLFYISPLESRVSKSTLVVVDSRVEPHARTAEWFRVHAAVPPGQCTQNESASAQEPAAQKTTRGLGCHRGRNSRNFGIPS